MFSSLLLATSLTAGQPPAYYPVPPGGGYPSLPRAFPVAQPVPPGMPPGAVPMTPVPLYGGVPNGTAVPYGGTAGSETGAPSIGPGAGPEEAGPKEEEPEPYLLERSIAETRLGQVLNNRGITIYGWTQGSYNLSSASGSNLPRTMDDRANEFLLNQNYLVTEKTLDLKKKEFQWGWRSDWILPGSDYRFSLPRGLWNDQLTRNNGGPELYGIDPYQFYLQGFLPGLGGNGTKVVLGRFATHCNFELVQAVDTPFVSRSYLFQYNPFTHTGLWASTFLNDNWTVGNGVATGADTFIDPANRATYLGQLKWAPPEGRSSATFNTVITNPKYFAREAFPFYNVYEMILTRKIGEKLTYVLDTAYSHIDDVPGVGYTDWYGASNYLIYQINNCWSTTLRAEVFNDTDGFRTGFEGLYTEATFGVAWRPTPGLIVRPSLRFDYNNQTAPFEGSPRLYTGTLECILRW